MKTIRTFSIENNSPGENRVKVNLSKVAGGYSWRTDEDDTIADEGRVYISVGDACTAARRMYGDRAWDMRCTW